MGKFGTSEDKTGENYAVADSEEKESEAATGDNHCKLVVLWQGQTDHCNL